jgi:hypothetical protein
MANKRVFKVVKMTANLASDNYPEIMKSMYVVNAPFLFSGVWAVCKGFVDEKTRSKIHIIGSSYQAKL